MEGHQAGQGAGAHGIQGKAERVRGAGSASRRESFGETLLLTATTSAMGTDRVRADPSQSAKR